jgi:hypothetical protein
MRVTYSDLPSLLDWQCHWSAESLAAMSRGKIEHPSEFFHCVVGGAAPAMGRNEPHSA